MLILSRKKDETVQIGEEIAITVIRVSGNKVRLGIAAPQGMRVLRLELEATPATEGDVETEKAA